MKDMKDSKKIRRKCPICNRMQDAELVVDYDGGEMLFLACGSELSKRKGGCRFTTDKKCAHGPHTNTGD